MTILQGTMQDGTVIPVQVDAQGRLVAEGIPGPAGPAGTPGGTFALPSDPKPGDLLGWTDAGLGWISGAPEAAPLTRTIITVVNDSDSDWTDVSAQLTFPVQIFQLYVPSGSGLFQLAGIEIDGVHLIGDKYALHTTASQQFSNFRPAYIFDGKILCDGGTYVSGSLPNAVITFHDNILPVARSRVRLMAKGGGPFYVNTQNVHPGTTGKICRTNPIKLVMGDATALSSFAVGDAVTEIKSDGSVGDASGTVGAIDIPNSTISLATSTGAWSVGSAVRGPVKINARRLR